MPCRKQATTHKSCIYLSLSLCLCRYGQEDAFILSQSAIDRGLFRSFAERAYRSTMPGQTGGTAANDKICQGQGKKNAKIPGLWDDSAIGCDGVVSPGQHVVSGDVLIRRTQNGIDKSETVRRNEGGVVSKVVWYTTEYADAARVQVVSARIPQIGDKFTDRHGQKGTIGLTLRQEDMPFTSEGVVPDIIVNVHSNSRMTLGRVAEMLGSKLAAAVGILTDGSAFANPNAISSMQEKMRMAGIESTGTSQLFHGHTGVPLSETMAMGLVYMLRLKHMPVDKMHSRARGPLHWLVRQPVDGRSRDGGLRFGEMERDAMLGYGSTAFLKDRLMYVADVYIMPLCPTCGVITGPDAPHSHMCKTCGSRMQSVRIPYATKILLQELHAMGINVKLKLSDSKNN